MYLYFIFRKKNFNFKFTSGNTEYYQFILEHVIDDIIMIAYL